MIWIWRNRQMKKRKQISVEEAMDPETGQPYDSLLLSGKVVLNHMQEFSDYFTRLEKIKSEVDEYQARRR
jgi:hypothetical protein